MPPPEDPPVPPEPPPPEPIEPDQLRSALDAIGLAFDDAHLEQMGRKAAAQRATLERLRGATIGADLAPAFQFDPWIDGVGGRPPRMTPSGAPPSPPEVERPDDLDDLAFASIPEQSALIRERRVSCVELATLAMDRLRRVDPILRCVVTLTAERALAQAAALDDELAAGQWRGPLHGIPWGAKDLLAVAGHPTTWGTPPFAGQRFDRDAAVVRRLDAAGAVLVAKLSLGELAWGDVWTGGRTVNPWDPAEGSSGSSAGSAAAVAAGAVPFAIGSETLGSITSPARICGVTGLRPTFGRVSRDGAMPLSWTMDKLGPMARSAEDCAIVLEAIAGCSPHGETDEAVRDLPAPIPTAADPGGWRIGVVEAAFDREPGLRGALDELRSFGCELVPVELPEVVLNDLWLIGEAESAAAFDDFLRAGEAARMVRQDDEAWPNVLRAARLIPAVEYLRASRLRRQLMLETDARLRDVDLVVHPTEDDSTLALENLTGHPAIAMPWGSRANGAPDSVTLAGHLDREADLLAFAMAWQERTEHHRRRPPEPR
jgi:Asp-tRNA(Asn)/Glu-tRNA(Gln) amidotransferase A subunit family amidase